MKVIHVPFCFRPDPIGGTEVYVEALAREQQRRGIDVVVAAPGRETLCHADNGLAVRRFATSASNELTSLYGGGDATARRGFERIVDQEHPDVVHLHAFTSAVSADLACEVQKRGVPLVFTYHTPTVSCQRGTLLRWGRDVCDGTLDVHLCAGCALHGLGVDRRAGALLGALPSGVGKMVGTIGLAGGLWTGLRMSDLVRTQQAAFRSFVQAMDRVVVLCQWAGDVLVHNGVPAEKLLLSRHGLPQPLSTPSSRPISHAAAGPLRIAFLGRFHPTKGVETLLRAMAEVPDAALELHLFGVSENTGHDSYTHALRSLATNDARIHFRASVPNDQVPGLLRAFDVVAVPSVWLETGPLVVLEAFAAGLPVVGSKRGGIAELVTDGVDGLLVEPDSIEAWSRALHELASDPALLQRLRGGVRPPKPMTDVADEMLSLYDGILQPR